MATTRTKDKTQNTAPPKEAPTGNLPATRAPQANQLVAFKDYADARMASLEAALPPHITPQAFMSVVLTVLQKKPSLLSCTQRSLWNACIEAATCGLLPDGSEGAIAPYGESQDGKKIAEIATFLPMIGGYRKLAYEGGLVSAWEVNLVRTRDDFDFALGDNPFIRHRPYFGSENPGAVVGAYSIVRLKDGAVLRDVMSLYELNQIKSKSKAQRGPWSDPVFLPEMHRKTMARRHYKQLPKTPALSRLIARENATFTLDASAPEQVEERRQRRIGNVAQAFDAFAAQPVDDVPPADDVPLADQVPDQGDDWQDASEVEATTKAKAATAKAKAAEPAQAASPVATASAGAAAQAASTKAAQAAPAPHEAPQPQETAPPDTADDQPSNDGPSEEEMVDRRWQPGAVPSTPDEYALFVRTNLENCSSSAKIKPWFVSEVQKELRAKCNVQQALYRTLQKQAMDRIAALEAQGK